MTLRRTTFTAIRLLAIYLIVRSLPGVLQAFDEARVTGFQRWIQLAAEAAPIAAAVALWLGASWLAVQCTGGEVLTTKELRLVLESQDETFSSQPNETAEPGRLRPLLLVGIFLLGLFLVVDAIAPLVFSVMRFALTEWVSFDCQFGPGGADCPFWNPDSIQALVLFGARVLQIAAGAWLILRPEQVLDRVEKLRRRWPAPSALPTEVVVDLDHEETTRQRWGPAGESENEER